MTIRVAGRRIARLFAPVSDIDERRTITLPSHLCDGRGVVVQGHRLRCQAELVVRIGAGSLRAQDEPEQVARA
jgi:hypothetical protein